MAGHATNRAPEWRPGMGDVEGMAAHPSMQARTDEELERLLAERRARIDQTRREFPPSPERDDVIASDERLVEATALALEWRRTALEHALLSVDCDGVARLIQEDPMPFVEVELSGCLGTHHGNIVSAADGMVEIEKADCSSLVVDLRYVERAEEIDL